VRTSVQDTKYLVLNGRRPPWTATQLHIEAGQSVSIFATGRLWRSRPLDLWLGPQFGLWCRLGENGTVFNSTHATNTFTADRPANFYLATQFPGQFGDPTGRVASPLRVYDKADGEFAVVITIWRPGSSPSMTLREMAKSGDSFDLVSTELNRQANPAQPPTDWHFLWFLGISDIFSGKRQAEGAQCICCHTHGNVGILQKEVVLPLTPSTVLSWDWIVSALPSRLREDTTASHDYLSIAVEFENGRDLTYTWSWELPVEFGYCCPMLTWRDREYHIVVRSGYVAIQNTYRARQSHTKPLPCYRACLGRPYCVKGRPTEPAELVKVPAQWPFNP
jgi:hypothetical protein